MATSVGQTFLQNPLGDQQLYSFQQQQQPEEYEHDHDHHPQVREVVERNQPLQGIDAMTPLSMVLDIMETYRLNTIAIHTDPSPDHHRLDLVLGGLQYIGFLSIVDIVIFITNSPGENLNSVLQLPAIRAMCTYESGKLWKVPWYKPVFKTLRDFSERCHHAIAYDKRSGKIRMYSQLDTMQYLYQNSGQLGIQPCLQQTIVSNVMNQDVRGTFAHHPMKNCFALLRLHRAIPVTDTTGRVITTLSTSDIAGRAYMRYATMNLSTDSAINFILFRHNGVIPVPITISPHDNFLTAMGKMVEYGIHRVWVVTPGTNILAGVITCSDIFAILHMHSS